VRVPVAYIRKSVVHKGARTISWEMQEADVRALAAKHGDEASLVVLSDWGKSGRGDKTHLRQGYRELVGRIEADQVSAVYAYSLSRISRSLMEYARLAKLCEDHDVRVRLAKEGELEFTSPSGRLVVGMLALVAQMEAELAQERARDVVRTRRAQGKTIGRGKYGTWGSERLGDVIDAFGTGGSYRKAAQLLNDRAIPTRLGGRWRGTSVRAILSHGAPELLPLTPTRGAKRGSAFLFARLLRCRCTSILSPHAPRGVPRYACLTSSDGTDHPYPRGVSEAKLMDWIREEASRVRPPTEDIEVVAVRNERVARIHEDIRRTRVMYGLQDLNDEEYVTAHKALQDELASLEAEGRVHHLEPPDWSGDRGAINDWLRALLVHVQLDGAMRPVDALWRVPAWRGEPTWRPGPHSS
jgi:DNA invertase Pin-like site-specific DNA recombinase